MPSIHDVEVPLSNLIRLICFLITRLIFVLGTHLNSEEGVIVA